MASFEELLEYNATQLESLTDEELRLYLAPCLKNCPPIDIKIVEEEEAKVKLIKLEKKEKEKAEKKALKLAAKLATNPPILTDDQLSKPQITKPKSQAKLSMLKSMSSMMEVLNKQIELQQALKNAKENTQSKT